MTQKLFLAVSVLCVLVLVLLVFGNKRAPLRTMRVRGDQPQWMTEEIRTAMNISDYLKNKLQRNKVTKLIDEAKHTYCNNLLTENANDASNIWPALKRFVSKNKTFLSRKCRLANPLVQIIKV